MERRADQIMGGMFGWKEGYTTNLTNYPFLKNSNTFVFNGRSAIYSIINTLEPESVWLPNYLCETILAAVKKTNIKIKFYNINNDLSIESNQWIDNLKNSDLVVLIEYFGFPVEKEIVEKIKEKKTIIVIDAAQSLLSENERFESDFVVYSPRKIIEVPNGAIIETKNKNFSSMLSLQTVPYKNLFYIYNAFQKRNLFYESGEAEWFNDYKESEKNQLIGNYRIDDYSYATLIHGINYNAISNARRRNFTYLLSEFSDIAIYKKLAENVVPMGFPVLVDNRDEILKSLYKQKIYPPVHWPVTDEGRSFDDTLRKKEVTLLCDQRYDIKDLKRMVKIIK